MRRLSITLFSLCLASALTAQTTGSNQSVRLRADNIDEVVSAMTLEEKGTPRHRLWDVDGK